MTRWKKNEKEFGVRVTNDRSGSMICRIPKPILDFLGKPNGIRFVISGKKIIVEAGDKS